MPEEDRRRRAPCVAVVGAANAGKTTLLHLVDAALQAHPANVLAYVVKGSPDGTGRYLLHSPELREAAKERVKGEWGETTIDTVCRWIDNARASLQLVLLDFGGRHSAGNERMLHRCSHYLVVSRTTETIEESGSSGEKSWIEVCTRCGLEPVGALRSLWGSGRPKVAAARHGFVEATFRSDLCRPGETINAGVISCLTETLLALSRERADPPYVDLRLTRDWRSADVETVGGRGGRLEELAGTRRSVVLGGRAPAWAYAAAMHRCLEKRPESRIQIFDPKIPGALIEIPKEVRTGSSSNLAPNVVARWLGEEEPGAATLDVRILSRDRFLQNPSPDLIAVLPQVAGKVPRGGVVVSGAIPFWLHLAYSRWLRSADPERLIGAWDARLQRAIWVNGACDRGQRLRSGKAPGERSETVAADRDSGEDECGEC